MSTLNASQPSQQDTQLLIQRFNAGELIEAEILAKSMISKHPSAFILHHILSLALDGQQKFSESIESYQNALSLKPNTTDLLFNCAIALTNLNRLDEAITMYQQAIKVKPNFFEAHGNLGTVLQKQGKLEEAIFSYKRGLSFNPQDARGYFNLGTALRDKGTLDEAVNSYRKAIALFPNYTDAHNNLGETLRDQGNMQEAIKSYKDALVLNTNHANANYNMAEFLYLAKKYDEAIPHFERSQLDDWQARCMYCLYKAKRFDEFKSKLDAIALAEPHTAPFIATLSTHYAINFGVEDVYHFCKNGLDFVYQHSIPELSAPDSQLRKALLLDIENANIAERVQGMLHNGKQSAGNLLKRPEPSFRSLAELIKKEFLYYKHTFAEANCELIASFPTELEFTSSWYVKMRQGGHLSSHIHEIGWISGAVYLAMPTPQINSNEGAFEYGTHGDDYPIASSLSLANFPASHVMPKVGDIVLFPSSLFHRTIPFNANEERICIAFDLKPSMQIS